MRKKTLLLVLVGALATASAAYAGWVIFSGAGGSSSDQPFASATQNTAVTISDGGTLPPADNTTGNVQVPLTVTNNNTGAAEKVTALTSTYTTKDSSGNNNSATCASFLSDVVSGAGPGPDDGSIIGRSIAASGTLSGHWDVHISAATPATCAGGSYKVTFTGTTSP